MRRAASSTIVIVLLVILPLMAVSPISVSQVNDDTQIRSQSPQLAQNGDVQMLMLASVEDESVSSFSPDTNFNGNIFRGGLFVGRDIFGSYYTSRSWLMFNLTHLPAKLEYINASLNVYCNESTSTSDSSIGAYFSDDDSWREDTITWNNQPAHNSGPEDVISSPASPDMFVNHQWYSWDVTDVFSDALDGDNILSLVLRQVDEGLALTTWKYFTEKDHNEYYAPYISVYYQMPETTDLTVDSKTGPPETDMIYSEHPIFGWDFGDSFYSHPSYEVQLRNDDDIVWNKNLDSTVPVFTAGVEEVTTPFTLGNSSRIQMLWSSSLISESGLVDRFYIGTSAPNGASIVLHNLTVLMRIKMTSSLGSVFSANYDGGYPTIVLARDYLELIAIDGYFAIDVENTFAINNGAHLLIEMRYDNQTGATVSCLAENGAGNGNAAIASDFADIGVEDIKTASVVSRTYNLKVDLISQTIVDLPGGGSQYPFDYNSARMQLKYNRSLINRKGYINKLFFECSQDSIYRPDMSFENFSILMTETTHTGPLSTTFSTNYGGTTPIEVLYRSSITIHNTGKWFTIELGSEYYYYNISDLLIEMRWDARTSEDYLPPIFILSSPAYRAIADDSEAATADSSDSTTYSIFFGWYDASKFSVYDGAPLPSGQYTFCVRTCNRLGIWSPWSELGFTYFQEGAGPFWSNLEESSNPSEVHQEVTVEIDVYGIQGVSSVLIEHGGLNHSMTLGTTSYWHTWTPTSLGPVDYAIFMEDGLGYWSTVAGSILVQDTVSPLVLVQPTDLEYTLGTTGHRIEWTSISEILPDEYYIYVDDVLERSGPWDGSDIGFNVDGLALGEHTVTLRLVDTSGNEAIYAVAVVVSAVTTTTTTTTVTNGLDLNGLLLVVVGGLGILNLILLLVISMRKAKE